jgi:hypothetical protein
MQCCTGPNPVKYCLAIYRYINLSWLQSTDFHTLHVYNSFIVDFVSCQIYMCIHCNFCIWHIDYNFKCIIFFYIWTWIIFMNLIFPKNWFPFYHMLVYLWNIYTNNKLYTWKMWYPRYMYFYIFFTPASGTCIFIYFSPQPQVHVFLYFFHPSPRYMYFYIFSPQPQVHVFDLKKNDYMYFVYKSNFCSFNCFLFEF